MFVYTSYPSAELFINGKSFGKQTKHGETPENRFRLMWPHAIYEPGEVKVVAYNESGKAVAEKTIHTAGKAHHIELSASRSTLNADGKDLTYVTLRVVDKEGNLCPNDNRLLQFKVKGAGRFLASANGDPTCLDAFHLPQMHAFGGMLTVILESGEQPGQIELSVHGKGLKSGKISITVQKNN